MRRSIVFVSMVIAFSTVAVNAQRPPALGVMDFQGGSGVSAIDAKTVSEVFRSELVTSGLYTVLERGKMEEILKEQQLQQTGCTSTECAVQIGKLLNMQKMLYGTVSKLGSRFYFVVTVVDIETSKVEKSVNDSLEGLDDLSKVIKRLIEQLSGGKRLVKEGESPFLKVHGMVKDNLFANVDKIKKEAPYITDAEKMQLVNQFKKDFWGPMWANIIPGFGIGSFSQGDLGGGFTGLLLDGSAVGLFIYGISRSGNRNLPTSEREIGGMIGGIGGIVWLSSRIIMLVWPIVYTISYNSSLERSLGLKVALDFDAGDRYASNHQESYASIALSIRY